MTTGGIANHKSVRIVHSHLINFAMEYNEPHTVNKRHTNSPTPESFFGKCFVGVGINRVHLQVTV